MRSRGPAAAASAIRVGDLVGADRAGGGVARDVDSGDVVIDAVVPVDQQASKRVAVDPAVQPCRRPRPSGRARSCRSRRPGRASPSRRQWSAPKSMPSRLGVLGQRVGADGLAGLRAADPHDPCRGRLLAEVVVEAEHAVDVGAGEVQLVGDDRHDRLCRRSRTRPGCRAGSAAAHPGRRGGRRPPTARLAPPARRPSLAPELMYTTLSSVTPQVKAVADDDLRNAVYRGRSRSRCATSSGSTSVMNAPIAGLRTGQVLQLVGGPLDRGDLQVQVRVLAPGPPPAPGATPRRTAAAGRTARPAGAARSGTGAAKSSRSSSDSAAMSGTWRCGYTCTSTGQRAAAGTNAVQCGDAATTRAPDSRSPASTSANRLRPVRSRVGAPRCPASAGSAASRRGRRRSGRAGGASVTPIAAPRFSNGNTCATPGSADSSVVRSAHASTTSRACSGFSVANAASWSLVKHTTSHRPTPARESTSGGRSGVAPPDGVHRQATGSGSRTPPRRSPATGSRCAGPPCDGHSGHSSAGGW